MPELLSGTVTILFTDIEGSTSLLQRVADRGYREVLDAHARLLQAAFAEHGGQIVETQGDAFLVAFRSARDAVDAGIAGQTAILQQAWPGDTSVRVRMGLHTGEPLSGGKGYVGLGVHRAARICAAGHGGRVPPFALGEPRHKAPHRRERLSQLPHPDLPASFPALKSLQPALQPEAIPGPNYRSPLAERLRRVPLVGRVEQLRRLVERLDGIRTGPTGMVLISGEPGIGKSRVLNELVAAARARGFEVLLGRCNERNLAIPYLPVAEALEGLARSIPQGKWERLALGAAPAGPAA